MERSKLTQARLLELVSYDPETGIFTRKIASRRWKAGERAGCQNKKLGYVVLRLDGVLHLGHRLAWLFTYGEWPKNTIDHINGNRADNRLCNLRDVPHRVNCENARKPHSNNTSGFLGVTKNGGRWSAAVTVDGSPKYLGQFDSPEEAHQAYVVGKRRLHVGCTL